MTTRMLFGVIWLTIVGLGGAYITGMPLFAGFSIGLMALVVAMFRGGGRFAEIAFCDDAGGDRAYEGSRLDLAVGRLADPVLDGQRRDWHCCIQIAAVIAMTLGTSTGTLRAVGIPLIGVASHLGVPLPLMAGAARRGAFVGDRTSPLSSAHQLVASSVGVPERSLFRLLQPTTYAAFGLGVPVERYAPYALFLWLPPLLTVAWSAWLGTLGAGSPKTSAPSRDVPFS
jgi:NhaC family Na+:H+ antiporter